MGRVTLICDASWIERKLHGVSIIGAGWAGYTAGDAGKHWYGAAIKRHLPNPTLAEACAIVNTLYTAIKQWNILQGDDVQIQTDCMPAIELLSRESYVQKGPETAHSFIAPIVHAAFGKLQSDHKLRIELKHIKGHCGIEGARFFIHNQCDQSARAHARKAFKNAVDKNNRERANVGSGR